MTKGYIALGFSALAMCVCLDTVALDVHVSDVRRNRIVKPKTKNPNDIVTVGGIEMTRAEMQNTLKNASLALNGGIIREPNSARGWFVVVDAQSRIALSNATAIVSELDSTMRIRAKSIVTNDVGIANIRSVINSTGASVGVAIVEDPVLPTLVSAPESGWSIVNASALAKDNPGEDVLRARIRKEVLRGYAFITGAPYMNRTDSLMRDVKSLEDIDRLGGRFGLEVINHSLKASEFYGIKPWNQASYRKACKDGWAPMPTNEYQTAIWRELNAKPTKPIKIEYDPKKGE